MNCLKLYAAFLCLFLMCFISKAQISEVTIGVNGLTCSACTRSVEMQVKKLDFVKDVEMDLESTQGVVHFKPNKKIDYSLIAKAVRDAGFSIREMKAKIDFDKDTTISNCLLIKSDLFVLFKEHADITVKDFVVQFIGEDFLPKSQYKSYKPLLKKYCQQSSARLYFVQII